MPGHYLRPLLAPQSVALVGATERQGALGRIVFQNLKPLGERLFAVNPKHATVFGRKSFRRLRELPSPPELAVVVTPARTVPAVIDEAGAAGIKAALVLSSGFGEAGAEGRALQAEALAAARRHGLRVLGPNCLGLMRPDCGVNATFARTAARPGKLALVSQSGAICAAILDWAWHAEIGFSSVVSLGAAADVDFGEILDFLAGDPATDAILMYVEGIRDARRFMSALRAAARANPVVALKVGRYASGSQAASSHTGALVGRDDVFEAALRRSGAVRVKTYTQLFAAARMLAAGKFPAGERLAIITNGGGPGVMAADCAAENGIPLAALSPPTLASLDAALPAQWSHGNPVDLVGDASAERYRAATAAVLADPGVDAVLAMYTPIAVTAPEDAAAAVAAAAHGSAKPVLGAWLGDIGASASRVLLDAHGVPNFYTPENAVEAFSFLCAYRRNQAQLLEVPAALAGAPGGARADLEAARAIRARALARGREALSEPETKALLAAFGIASARAIACVDRSAALEAARDIGYPVALKILSPDIPHKSDAGGVRLDLENAERLGAAVDDMFARVRALRPAARPEGVVVEPMLRFAHGRELLVGVATDPVFGPVISFGAGGVAVEAVHDAALALPPLNALLARDLVSRTRISRLLTAYRDVPAADLDALAELLVAVSRMVCALPWIREMDLNPVIAHPAGAVVADARVAIDPARLEAPPRYGHMAIHPYPAELEGTLILSDGRAVPVRPMRPEDAALEQRFFDRLSERSRYLRFQHHVPNLSKGMLARFTQLDYDRELALVVLDPASGEFVAVGRYAPNADGTTAEFALAVADDWQSRGIGRVLLERLCQHARAAGYEALFGQILNANRDMIDLAAHLGFERASEGAADVTVVRRLAPGS